MLYFYVYVELSGHGDIIHYPSRCPRRRRQRLEPLAQLLLEELKAVLAALSTDEMGTHGKNMTEHLGLKHLETSWNLYLIHSYSILFPESTGFFHSFDQIFSQRAFPPTPSCTIWHGGHGIVLDQIRRFDLRN